jgi:hypothetical protein
MAGRAPDRLAAVVDADGNVFAELIRTVEHCSLGQITNCLQQLLGRYRPTALAIARFERPWLWSSATRPL